MLSHLRNHQIGDTIVEVLIAIAVFSSVLGSTYAIINRTNRSQQQSVERTAALKLAETQLERLRDNAQSIPSTDTDSIFNSSVPPSFCMNSNSKWVVTTDNACKQDVTAVPATQVITRLADGVTFAVDVSWENINGNSTKDAVNLSYKVYP